MSDQDDRLESLRHQIDTLDEEILKLLARRMSIVREVGNYKSERHIAPLDSARWQAVIKTRLATAKSLNMSEAFITQLYQLIHNYALEIERQSIDKASS